MSKLDLAIVLDTTGSMERVARDASRMILEAMAGLAKGDFRVALVLYRDHAWEDSVYTTKVYPFMRRAEAFTGRLWEIVYAGGGDTREAALDGLVAAANLRWREGARRECALITDAPFHDPCACGLTAGGVAELLGTRGIRLSVFLFLPPVAPGLSRAFSADARVPVLKEAISAYDLLARATGGALIPLRDGVPTSDDPVPDATTPEGIVWI